MLTSDVQRARRGPYDGRARPQKLDVAEFVEITFYLIRARVIRHVDREQLPGLDLRKGPAEIGISLVETANAQKVCVSELLVPLQREHDTLNGIIASEREQGINRHVG